MTIIVTRNAPDRFRGFLSSVMLEISPGVYVNPYMTQGIRERTIAVCLEWSSLLPEDGCITTIWRSKSEPGGLGLQIIGAPKTEVVDLYGIWIDRHPLTQEQFDRAHYYDSLCSNSHRSDK